MTMGRTTMLAVGLALALGPGRAAAQDLPEYTCRRAAVAPRIDGAGDDEAWASVDAVRLVDVRILAGQEHPHATEARLTWDAAALYVLIRADDPDVWSTLAGRDDPLYNEEVVELFIDPDGDGANYVEIEVNSLNTVFDLLVTKALRSGGQGRPEWSPEGLATAVGVTGTLNDPADTDEGWVAELALPWAALGTDLLDVPGDRDLPPAPGDSWRVNLYRYERPRTAAGVESGDIEYSAWSPVGRVDFHAPERFGVVVFAGSGTAVDAVGWAALKGQVGRP